MMSATFSLLLIVLGLLQLCSSYPADQRGYKESNPIPIPLLLLSLPMEIEEPKYRIENLPGSQFSSSSTGTKHKRQPDTVDSCCPTVTEIIEPLGGKNRSGDLVELYQGDGVRQRFYEVSCAPSVADGHCKYLDRRHMAHSKCVQQYSYTYALVRDFGVSYEDSVHGGWRLDYIQIRTGCSCQITPRHSPHSTSS